MGRAGGDAGTPPFLAAEASRPARGTRPRRATIEQVIVRLELLGYRYRGCDWPNGGVYVMYADPATPDDTWLLVGATLADIMARIGELPIPDPDPLVARVEALNRKEWR